MVRSLWAFRDLLATERPCTEVELAELVASAPMLCIEAKIALLAWVLIVGSWMGEKGSTTGLTAKEKRRKLSQLAAVATHVMKEDVGTRHQKAKLDRIFKDVKKVLNKH